MKQFFPSSSAEEDYEEDENVNEDIHNCSRA
jgi:hypothetical protein